MFPSFCRCTSIFQLIYVFLKLCLSNGLITVLQVPEHHGAVLEGVRHQQDFAHILQKARTNSIANFPNSEHCTLGFCFFHMPPKSIAFSLLRIRYCVIQLAHLQEITTAFIISKNGYVRVLFVYSQTHILRYTNNHGPYIPHCFEICVLIKLASCTERCGPIH